MDTDHFEDSQKTTDLDLFTDRREIVRTFAAYLNGPPRNTILFLHGEGGNGKSLLLKYLIKNFCKLLNPEEQARINTMSDSELRDAFAKATASPPFTLLNFNPPPLTRKDPRDPFIGLTGC